MRNRVRYSELTSLLDVLFILLFASLIQAAGMVSAAELDDTRAQTPAPTPTTSAPNQPPPDAAPSADAAPPPTHVEIKQRALDELMKSMGDRSVIYVRVSAAGLLTAIERDGDGVVDTVPLSIPLLERVADPDIAVVYLGEQSPELSLCSRVRVVLGLRDLADHLVVFVPDAPLDQLPVALVDGLRRDQERCLTGEGGVGVLVPVNPEDAR